MVKNGEVATVINNNKIVLFFLFLWQNKRLANEVANNTRAVVIEPKMKKWNRVKHWQFGENGQIYQPNQDGIFLYLINIGIPKKVFKIPIDYRIQTWKGLISKMMLY